MQECVSNPMPVDEVELLHKLYKTGPYSEAYKPELLKWALKKCADDHSQIGRTRAPRKLPGQGVGGGKLQLEEERKRLILEIENG